MRFIAGLILLLVMLMPARVEGTGAPAVGGRIAFVRDGDLWLWEAGQERQLTRDGGVERPRFSADGEYVAFAGKGGVQVIRVAGGGPWTLPDIGSGFAWSPTEPGLGFLGGVHTVRLTPAGPEQPVKVLSGGWSFGAWSPDGRRMAVLNGDPGEELFSGTAWLGVADPATDEVRTLLKETYPAKEPATCPVGGANAPASLVGGRQMDQLLAGRSDRFHAHGLQRASGDLN